MTAHPISGRGRTESNRVRVHHATLQQGIRPTPEFAKKGLASFAVNVGTKCGHGCLYCSTGAMLRTHHSFKKAGENPFKHGYAIVDPGTPARVAAAAAAGRDERGLVQLCTTVDAWAPEAKEHDLGRRCLEALLAQSGWQVRILTKNASVRDDFDLIEQHRDRVLVGLSLTAVPSKQKIIEVIEPHASPIGERIAALKKAHALGLRTYAMLCPLLPGIADDRDSVRELVRIGLDVEAEEYFVEPVNSRGSGLILTVKALRDAGFAKEADEVDAVRHGRNWSPYVRRLLDSVQQELKAAKAIGRLRFLLYPTQLQPEDLAWVRKHDAGVRWLGKDEGDAGGARKAPDRVSAPRSRPVARRGRKRSQREETTMTTKRKKPASKRPPKTAIAKPMPALPGAGKLDQKLVDGAVAEINRLQRIKKIEAVQAIGQFVLATFFEGKFENFHHHGRKHASFRALAKHEDLGMSYVTLRNSVAFVEQFRLLPPKVASALPYSHHRALLPVATMDDKKALAEKAVEKDMSKRQLEQEVRKVRSKAGAKRGPGRRPDPAFALAFRRLAEAAKIAAREAVSKTDFTRLAVDDAERLVGEAERHLEALGDVVEKAKKAIAEFREKNKDER